MGTPTRNRNEVQVATDSCHLFAHESEPDLHRIDVVVSRLRHKARQQGIHLPVRAILVRLALSPERLSMPAAMRDMNGHCKQVNFFSFSERNERNETDDDLKNFLIVLLHQDDVV